MPETYDLIRDAILNKRQVIATHDGHLREMCPHVLGIRDGITQALFYQFGGSNGHGAIIPGAAENWRWIPIDCLSEVTLRCGPWFSGPARSMPARCIDLIEIEAAP